MRRVTAEAWVAIGALAFTTLLQAAGLLIWGASLTQRVKTLEAQVAPLMTLPERLVKVETLLGSMITQLTSLNTSIMWMREPADYTAINPRSAR